MGDASVNGSLPPAAPSLAALLRSDRDAALGRPASRVAAVRSWPRFVTHRSLRACLLLRLSILLPRPLAFIPRNLLIALHRMDCVLPVAIGPRLHLPDPEGICIGRLVAGRDLTLHREVTLGGARPHIPPMQIGDGVTVGARTTALVDGMDLPAGASLEPDLFIYKSLWIARRVRGGKLDEEQARLIAVPPDAGLRRLLYADYVASTGTTARGLKGLAGLAIRFLTSPSLHACVLVRLASAAGLPPRRLWRALLRAKHAIDVQDDVQIGGGLWMAHPMEIVFGRGARIGSAAKVGHRVTFRPSPAGEHVVLGDDVLIYPSTVFEPGARVGDGASIGAYAHVEGEVAAGSIHRGRTPSPAEPYFVGRPIVRKART